MRRFYVFWFFFSAGWGALFAKLPSTPLPILPVALASFAGGAMTLFLLIAVELWRMKPEEKSLPLSLSLKPWDIPLGLSLFILLTFLFSSVWGLGLAFFIADAQFLEPTRILFISSGGLFGMWGACRVFSSRFVA